MFKKKFLKDIQLGKKTQTLRFWKHLRIHSNQKNFIPGVGPIWIDSVDEVYLDNLTDQDAIPDGFSTIDELRKELDKIYGINPEGKLYRIRFHLLPPESPPEPVPLFLAEIGKKEEVFHKENFSPSVSEQNKNSLISNDSAVLPQKTQLPRLEKPISSDSQTDNSSEVYRNFAYRLKLDVKKQLDEWDGSVRQLKFSNASGNQNVEKELLTEEQIVEKMIRRCRINRNVCDWNHEPGKSQDFFALFLQAPRNEKGVPTLDGYRLRSLMRDQLSETQWEEICWIAAEVCAAWTEWQYAVEHWKIDCGF